jgi:uncharacterized protein (TIGR04168 family)
MTPLPPPANLTIVGDVHRQWRAVDGDYLERVKPDLAMFVGDLGDEDPGIVAEIAALRVSKAVILGNHDAWESFKRRYPSRRLKESLQHLGDDHLGYAIREVPTAGVSVIGARPFSWGGQSLRSPELYDTLYGVRTHKQSAAKIVELARKADHDDLVILAHNGPLGLSEEPRDIYGKDFGQRPGGDWGDRDLQLALQRIAEMGRRVRMVVAGHMHHELVHPRGDLRVRFCKCAGTTFVNPAVVPRVREASDRGAESYFVRTYWSRGMCLAIEEVWVDERGQERSATTPRVVELEPRALQDVGEDSKD